MALYDDASIEYDDITLLYDGLVIDDFALLVDVADVTQYLAQRSLRVNTATHGNSLGTLDATLNDPIVLPNVEQEARLYVDFVSIYEGIIRTTETREYRGGHLFATFGAQGQPIDWDGLPDPAPYGISDDPDGVTTIGYESVHVNTRTTEGGSPKTTATVVIREDGFLPGMNVELTSDNYGYSAEEFAINEVSVEWPLEDAPRYTLTLGDPIVSLEQMVQEGDLVSDGSITETKISDGAITTPKLHADAVIANVANVADTVVIDADGIEVTDGAITVVGPDATVIIDGTSNMFKIAATGTISDVVNTATGATTITSEAVTLTALGTYASPPAFIDQVYSDFLERHARVGFWLGGVTPGTIDVHGIFHLVLSLDGSDQLVVTLDMILTGPNTTHTLRGRYYILHEAGI